MRDVEDGDAVGAQLLHDPHDQLTLGEVQRRGRLVEHDRSRVGGQCLGDLYQLALPGGQVTDDRLRAKAGADPAQDRCGGLAQAPGGVPSRGPGTEADR